MEYWKNRKEKTLKEAFGHYRLEVRYMANCNSAQVTMYDVSVKYPFIWSHTVNDQQANSALTLFKSIGYFDLV